METQLLRDVASLGLGAVIAVILLVWKRQDDQKYAGRLGDLTERVLSSLDGNTKAMKEMAAAVETLCSLQKVEDRLRQLEKKVNGSKK